MVALRGVLTPPEARLANSPDPTDEVLVRELRRRLVRAGEGELADAVKAALGLAVRAVLSDLDPAADEAVLVFALNSADQPEQ